MDYLLFILAHGRPAPDELAVMQREIPAWVEEMDGRGVRRYHAIEGRPFHCG